MQLPLERLRTKGHRQRGRSAIPSIPILFSFLSFPFFFPLSFPKDNPTGATFLFAQQDCLPLARKLTEDWRPTDVCSAAAAITSRHHKNIVGFLLLHFSSFVLLHRRFFIVAGQSRLGAFRVKNQSPLYALRPKLLRKCSSVR